MALQKIKLNKKEIKDISLRDKAMFYSTLSKKITIFLIN
jgi:hypothetical protein